MITSRFRFGLISAGSIILFGLGLSFEYAALCCLSQLCYEMSLQVAPSQERIVGALLTIVVCGVCGCVLMLYSIASFNYLTRPQSSHVWYRNDVLAPVSDRLIRISILSDDPDIQNLTDEIDMIMGSAGSEQPGEGPA